MDSELTADAIDWYLKKGESLEQAVAKTFPLITGAFSLVMMDKENLIAVRDSYGMRPLALGKIKNNYIVKFKLDGHENRALFTKNGQLVYHITYGTEKLLPAEVRKLVKGEYYDQKITKVLKVKQDQRTIWVIHMEDDKEFIMARVEDGELEETKRMEK